MTRQRRRRERRKENVVADHEGEARRVPLVVKGELEGLHALIRFSRDPARLDELVAGRVYCKTPEYYRMLEAKGIGDRLESCVAAYRAGRDPPDWQVVINGVVIDGVTGFTFFGTMPDHWLHCWAVFRMPRNSEELVKLAADMRRMREEFGHHYVIVPGEKVGSNPRSTASRGPWSFPRGSTSCSRATRASSPA